MDGILIINKPAGMTSHDVISRLRRKYGQKKFGHTGTLDPQATGVLVVLAGKATKLLPYLKETDKEYVASVQFGQRTDTEDIWGNVLEEKPVNEIEDFGALVDSLKGELNLRVPAASAKKVNGKKLLDYQLAGQEVPELYQKITVYDSEVTDPEKHQFRIACSSGTYIRAICTELGRRSGNLAAMSSLVRTKASGFSLDQAEPLDQEMHTVYPMLTLLDGKKVEVSNFFKVKNGQPLELDIDEDQALMIHNGELAAIYRRKEGNLFVCERGFLS